MAAFTSQSSVFLLLLLYAIILNQSMCSNHKVVRCNEKDRGVLLMFKHGVIDPSNSLSTWSTERDCCAWEGVRCDSKGRVQMLDLRGDIGYALQGEINLSLLELEFLIYLDLSSNYFESISIPPIRDNVTLATPLQYLNLSDNLLMGSSIPELLGQQEKLQYVDLSSNEFNGSIPHFLGQQKSLQYLDLSENSLGGSIPDLLGQHKNLQYIDLSNNEINGSIPDLLGQQKNLQHLDLSYNQLKGSIPDSFGQQKSLQFLDLSFNHLNGSIPEWVAQKKNLQHLGLSNNLFYGSILSILGNLSSLVSLGIGSNSFSGTISETFFSKLYNLEYLDLSNSTFEFHFGPEWIPPFQLKELYLANTNQGPYFPSWIYTQKSLEALDVSSSGISSVDGDKFRRLIGGRYYGTLYMSNNSINEDLSNLVLNCSFLKLDHNNFTGELPRLSPMVYQVDVSHNFFSGSIPRHWGNFRFLNYINLWSNRLSGEIPLDLSNMTSLLVMNLGKNEFSGAIPVNLPQQLEVMILRSNQFEGNIPAQLFDLSYLFHLDLAHNKLSGSMPRSTYNMTEMITDEFPPSFISDNMIDLFTKGQDYEYNLNWDRKTIDLSANNLSGEIPLGLFGLIQVQTLNLSYNQFTGTIQKAIGGMKNLESLDLSNNKLYGEIPQSMAALSFLGYLNLSCNDFTGQIPIGTQLQSFAASSYIGNPELCGAPLRKCGTGEDPKNAKQDPGDADGDLERESLYLGMGVGFAVGFCGICGFFVLNGKWRHTYYQFLDRVADQVYVTLMVKFNKFRKN